VIAANTWLPVIGIPIQTSTMGGLDSLLSIAQMPAGVPVGTMSVGSGGARNAGIFAAQILALGDQELRQRLLRFKDELAQEVARKNERLRSTVAELKND
jgi:phosphoribosylaminoimidazole carboxylase PurE protein